ncbi:MAG TPA: helix-turn-helix domain-containing GNAT family N-acetyltransferase, partial [Rhodanobacteraceae bacterium]|nr:helix-turn-helix domain-containing GNAT family N-acetyltransferase [Rhodanobacteraceae bacterium]
SCCCFRRYVVNGVNAAVAPTFGELRGLDGYGLIRLGRGELGSLLTRGRQGWRWRVSASPARSRVLAAPIAGRLFAIALDNISDYSQEMTSTLATVRSFNRTVTQRLGVLNEKYLGRAAPLVESRLLFEIGTHGVLVRDLRARMALDSGFLSRLLRALEAKQLVRTTRPPAGDARTRLVQLTAKGRRELRRVDDLSDALAKSLVSPLSKHQADRLVTAMGEVDCLLHASAVEITETAAAGPEAQWCLKRYYDELAVRFPDGFRRPARTVATTREFAPPTGRFLVAQSLGNPVGCGALRHLGEGVGEIKRMWVLPELRGTGISRRLLAAIEHSARDLKVRTIRLDTNDSLVEALQLYRSSGYHEIARYNDNPYAQHWFEKDLDVPAATMRS